MMFAALAVGSPFELRTFSMTKMTIVDLNIWNFNDFSTLFD